MLVTIALCSVLILLSIGMKVGLIDLRRIDGMLPNQTTVVIIFGGPGPGPGPSLFCHNYEFDTTVSLTSARAAAIQEPNMSLILLLLFDL